MSTLDHKRCSQPGSDLPQSMEAGTSKEREYEFIVRTEEPHQPEGPERDLIRRIVMKNFFEKKGSDVLSKSSEHSSASTMQAKAKLKSRFRLPKPGQKTVEKKPKYKTIPSSRRKSQIEEEEPYTLSRASREISNFSEASQPEPISGKWSGTILSSSGRGLDEGRVEEKPGLSFKISPGAHKFDPFDVLPVPGTPRLNLLFKLYKPGMRTNSLAINARHTWWTFISKDAGLLHATLATWALYGQLVGGMKDLQVDKLRHKNEAIKEVNTKIAGGAFSDELIGTVATLASFENLVGAYDAAQLHIVALKRMVNARGGLFSLGHNDGLIKGILWVDFHTSAAFRTPPSFPQVRLDPDTPPLPDELLDEAACTSPTSLLQLSNASIECFNIFYRLHRLALASSTHWIRQVSRLTFSDMLYHTEYAILSVPDCSRDFLDFDLENRVQPEDYNERANFANGVSVTEALLAAAQIFIYASLRGIPRQARIFSILLERLRVSIDRPNVCTIRAWKDVRNLHMLLWVLIVACSVVSDHGKRDWWRHRLCPVIEEMRIRNLAELKEVLRRVAWTDVFFEGMLEEIWEEATRREILEEDVSHKIEQEMHHDREDPDRTNGDIRPSDGQEEHVSMLGGSDSG